MNNVRANRARARELTALAVEQKQEGELEQAEEAARRALALNPRSVQAMATLCSLYRRMGRAEEAVAVTDRVKDRGGSEAVHCSRAAALLDLGRLPEARHAANRAVGFSKWTGGPSAATKHVLARLAEAEGATATPPHP